MKLLQIPDGGIDVVRMSQIQNLVTMGYIAKTMRESGIKKLADINILEAPSMGYIKTTMQQAGYELINAEIKGGNYASVKQLKASKWDIPDNFMNKYGLTDNSQLYLNFNIEIKTININK